MENDNSGIVIGKRHSQCDSTGCGVRFVVESTGQNVEVEGGGCTTHECYAGEFVLGEKALSDETKRDYINKTNAEILDEINKRSGAGSINKPVKRLKGGETVITVKASQDPERRTYKNVTAREVASMINQRGGGVALASGGYVLGEKRFTEVTTDELEDYLVFQYFEDSTDYKPAGYFSLWMYDEKNPNEKEYDLPEIPKYLPSELGVNKLEFYWTKRFQQNKKGAEHILGVIEGKYDSANKVIMINYMTVKPSARRQGINREMVKWLKNFFKTDTVQFNQPTYAGKKFMAKARYAEGGDLPKFMFDIKFITWELSTDGSTKSLRIIYDPDIAIDVLTLQHGILDSDWIRTDMFEQEPYKVDGKYDLFKLRDFIVDNLSDKTLDNYRKEGLKYNLLKYLELDKSAVSFRLNQEMLQGGEADNLTLKEIAEITGVPLREIIEQVLYGIEEEKEHSTDIYTRKEIAKDHIIKSPYIYENLAEAEEKGKIKRGIEDYTASEVQQLVEANNENADKREAELVEAIKQEFGLGGAIKEKTLTRDEFKAELYKRIVDVDRYGKPRNEKGVEYWKPRVDLFIYSDNGYMINQFELMYSAYLSGLYNLDDINDQSIIRLEEILSNETEWYHKSGEGFGSSDKTILIEKFINADGVRTTTVNGRVERVDKKGNVIKTALRYEKGGCICSMMDTGGAVTSEREQHFEFTNIVPLSTKTALFVEDAKLILQKDEEISNLIGKDFVLKGAMEHNLEKLVKIPYQSVVHVLKVERPTFREDQETFHRAYSLTLVDDLSNVYVIHYKNEDDFFEDFMPLTREYYVNRVVNFLKSLGIIIKDEKFKIWLRTFDKKAREIYDLNIEQLKQIFAHLHNQEADTLKNLFSVSKGSVLDASKFESGGNVPESVSTDPNIKKSDFYKIDDKNIRYKDFVFSTIKIQGKKILAVDMPSLQQLTEEQQREYFSVMKAVKNVDFTKAEIYKRPTPFEIEVSDEVAHHEAEYANVEFVLTEMMKKRKIEWERGQNSAGGTNNVYKFYNYSDYLFFRNMNAWLYTSKKFGSPTVLTIDSEKVLHYVVLKLIAQLINFDYRYDEQVYGNSWNFSFSSLKEYNAAMEAYNLATFPTTVTDSASDNKLFVTEKYYQPVLDFIAAENIKAEVLPKTEGVVGDIIKFETTADYLKVAQKYIEIIKTVRENEVYFRFKENPTDADVYEWLKQYNGSESYILYLARYLNKNGSLSGKFLEHAHSNYKRERDIQELRKAAESNVPPQELQSIEIFRHSKPEEKTTINVGDEIKFSYIRSRYSEWQTFNAMIRSITKTLVGIEKEGVPHIAYLPVSNLSYYKKYNTIIITNYQLVRNNKLEN